MNNLVFTLSSSGHVVSSRTVLNLLSLSLSLISLLLPCMLFCRASSLDDSMNIKFWTAISKVCFLFSSRINPWPKMLKYLNDRIKSILLVSNVQYAWVTKRKCIQLHKPSSSHFHPTQGNLTSFYYCHHSRFTAISLHYFHLWSSSGKLKCLLKQLKQVNAFPECFPPTNNTHTHIERPTSDYSALFPSLSTNNNVRPKCRQIESMRLYSVINLQSLQTKFYELAHTTYSYFLSISYASRLSKSCVCCSMRFGYKSKYLFTSVAFPVTKFLDLRF